MSKQAKKPEKKPESRPTTPLKKAPKRAADLRWLYTLIIVVTVIVMYSRTMSYQYVKMDDTDLIVENESFIKHTKNIPQAFRQSCFQIPGHLTDSKSYYRPMLIVSFIVDAQLHGARSSSTFHFMNILYHIICCLLLFWLLMRLGVSQLLSFALAFLFAVHPVHTHAIAWIPGRNDILLSMFVLLSLHGLIGYVRRNDIGNLILHILAFAAALFTKESAVLLVPLYVGFMWLWMRDLAFYKRKFFLPIMYAALGVVWYIAMKAALKGQPMMGGSESLVSVALKNLPYLFLYIGKILLPFNLNVMPGANGLAYVLGSFSILGLAYIFSTIKDIRKALFSLGWYFMFLLPTLLVPELPAYEHRDYLPLIGLMLGISQSGLFAGFSFTSKNALWGMGILAVLFIVLTSIRMPVFSSRYTFWMDGTDGTPFSASACVNMGELYQEEFNNNPELNKQQKNEALGQAGTWNHTAIQMDSATLRGNNNYGAYLYLTGKPDEAKPYFEKEIKFHPTNSDPYKNLGIYYKDKGQAYKSVYYWEKLISLNRFYLTAYEDLASYYAQQGDMAKATMYRAQEKELTEEAQK